MKLCLKNLTFYIMNNDEYIKIGLMKGKIKMFKY